MNEVPLILYYDNMQEALDTLKDSLELEDIPIQTRLVQSENDLEDLEKSLQEWRHLVIADVCLIDEENSKGKDQKGLEIILRSDPVVPKIIWTAISNLGESQARLRFTRSESSSRDCILR
jgi:hypothetical protein